MSLNFILGFFVFITGLCIGSFLNVVILRALSGESIVFPASKCPKCQTPLKWWHNIPVISYIGLRGKCAFCHEKISIQYPIIELLTGYLFLSAFLKFGIDIKTIFAMCFLSMFIVIAMTDIKEKVCFDWHCYTLAIFGLIYNFFNFGELYSGHTFIFYTSFIASILGLLLGAGIIAIIFGLGYLFFKGMVIGVGDILIAGALGACFGYKYILFILLGAFILQVAIIIPLFLHKLYKKKNFKLLIPFVLFIAISCIEALYFKYLDLGIMAINWGFAFVQIAFGYYLVKQIIATLPKNIDEIQNSTEDATRVPFGPALVAAALVFLSIH